MKILSNQKNCFIQNLTKSFTEGIYADTPQNRKLGRVGMSYADYTNKIQGHEDKRDNVESLKNSIYKDTKELTSHFYSDEDWKGVNKVIDKIKETLSKYKGKLKDLKVEVSVKNGGYGKSNGALYKEYNIDILSEKTPIIQGKLVCHGAGSVKNPMEKYDMSLVIFVSDVDYSKLNRE